MKYPSASALSIIDRFARRLMVDGDPAPAGGSSPEPVVAPPAGGGAAPPAGEAPAAAATEPKSLLSDAPVEGVLPAEEPKVETPEEKAARLAAETPEQKTEREKVETEAKAAKLATYDVLKLPEGMPADQPAFVDFKSEAADLDIPPEKAQRLLDKVAPKIMEATKAPYELWADTQEKWVAEVKADPIIGKDLDRNIAIAARAIDSYGSDADRLAVRKALAFTGAGNHPDIVRWMHRVGSTLQEGKPVNAKPAEGAKPSLAQKAYPSMQPT